MKKIFSLIAFILCIDILFACWLAIPYSAYGKQKEVAVKPRVVVNGNVKELAGYQVGGEYYFKPKDIEKVMASSSKPFVTKILTNMKVKAVSVKIKNTKYYRIRDIAKSMNYSYTHDTALDAAYIWTDIYYDEDEQVVREEISRAAELELITAAIQNNLDKQITFKELCSMLRKLIEIYDSKLVSKWDKIAKKAASSNLKMTRGDGMLAIFEAADVLGMSSYNVEWSSLNGKIGTKCWDELNNRNTTMFSNIWDRTVKYADTTCDYNVASYFYSFGRQSKATQRTLFDYNEEANSMLPDIPLTRKDAIKAIIRLYESSDDVNLVSLSEIGTYNKAIITEELLSYAKEMPEPTDQKLPYYTGFCIEVKGGNEQDGEKFDQNLKSALWRQWNEKDIRMTSEWGFNYLRVKEDYEYLFDEAVTKADLNEFEKIDRLIAWALKYRVHIDYQLEDYPGWANKGDRANPHQDLDYFNNPVKQERTKKIWSVIANRYKGIPNSVLTFSINHEIMNPTRSSAAKPAVFTPDDIYRTTTELINTIRAIDNDRLMFFESAYLGEETPLVTPYMKDAGLVQTFKNMGTNAFQYWNFKGMDGYDASGFLPCWPLVKYDLSRGIAKQEDGRPSLAFKGALHKDTVFNISIDEITEPGRFTVKADGKEIYSQMVSPDTKASSFQLNSNTQKMDLYFDGNMCWSDFTITLPQKYEIKKRWYRGALSGEEPLTKEVSTSTIVLTEGSDKTTKWNYPYTITLNNDLTYTTDGKKNDTGKETLLNAAQSWIQQCKENGIVGMCNEIALGCSDDSADILQYLDDATSAFKEYGIGWVDFGFASYCGVMNNDRYGVTPIYYNGYMLDVEMLKILQKNQGN